MTVKPRHRGGHPPEDPRQSGEKLPAQQPVGRPKGEPSTIVNVGLPPPYWPNWIAILTSWSGRQASRPTAARSHVGR